MACNLYLSVTLSRQIILLFEGQLKIGDFIEITPQVRGEIRAINVRSTVVSTLDGMEVIVPNAEFISNKVIHWTLRHPYRRYHVPFSVAYGTDPEHVITLIQEIAKKMPHTIDGKGFHDPLVIIDQVFR